jgi:hypothetical protein
MRLPSHATGFDLANSLHLARYRDNASSSTPLRARSPLRVIGGVDANHRQSNVRWQLIVYADHRPK